MGDKPLSSASNTPGPSGLSGVSTPVEPPRKEKRKKRREREQAEANAQAGPSSISLKDKRRTKGDGSGAATPIVVEDTPPAPERTFDPGVDFIPFGLSDEPEGEDRTRGKSDRERASDRPVNREREWDRGKGKARQWEQRADERDRDRDRNGGARKRKADDYDRNDGYENKKQRMDAASRKAPWVAGVDWEASANVAELLHREVKAFVHYISPTPEEDEVRSLIVEMISQAVTKNFPDAKVLPFGSFETKLYLPLGDIDLVVLSQSMAYSDRVTVLHALANTLKRAGITDKVTIIAKAKVPIIKFVTIHGRFAVDISINQSNGVEAGKMVNGFLAEMPALQSLVMITKAFLSQRSMNEVFSGGLGSYSIVCLAVSFLQMHPKIRRGEIDPMQNLGVLVMEFFELYGFYFNYQEVGISLRGGGTYYSKVQRGWSDYQKSGLLSIEDPGDPSNDVSKGSYNINRVRQTFAGAHGIMTAAAYMQASVLSARRSGRSVNLRGHTDPGDMSILSSVLGVTQETINRRRLVMELYDKRILHRMLGIAPKAPIVNDNPNANGSSSRIKGSGASSVKSVWEAAERSDDDHHPASPKPKSRARAREDDKEGDDESRYAIPKKRRRLDTAADAHTVFTTDDDEASDEAELVIHTVEDSDDGSLEKEAEEYDVLSSGSESGEVVKVTGREKRKSGGPVKIDRKRAFWAAKGGRGGTPESASS